MPNFQKQVRVTLIRILKTKIKFYFEFFSNATVPKTKLLMIPKKNYSLCLVIKQILSLRNLNYIRMYSFTQSVVTWSSTGSKTAHSLQEMTLSSGSVITLQNFLKCSSNETKTLASQTTVTFLLIILSTKERRLE